MGDGGGQHVTDGAAEERCRRRVQLRGVLGVEVEDDAVVGGQEHPVGNRPQDRPGACLAVLERLVGAALLDGDAGDVGGDVDQLPLVDARRARLRVVHRQRAQHLALR